MIQEGSANLTGLLWSLDSSWILKPFLSAIYALSHCDMLDTLLASQWSNFKFLILPL
jgi:hypothetical protein